jgi:cytochrome c-type biogenesis protein CcmE
VKGARTAKRNAKSEAAPSSVRRRRKVALALIVISIVLIVIGVTYRPVNYHTVDEVMDHQDEHLGKKIEVKGEVKTGSLSKGNVTSFVLKGSHREMNVTYGDMAPDGFVEGKDIVVKGTLGMDGTFRASSITVGCPSRYAAGYMEV